MKKYAVVFKKTKIEDTGVVLEAETGADALRMAKRINPRDFEYEERYVDWEIESITDFDEVKDPGWFLELEI